MQEEFKAPVIMIILSGFSLYNQRQTVAPAHGSGRVHKLATPLGIEPRISGFIRGSSLNLS